MRFWKLWTWTAALVGGLAGTAQAQYPGYLSAPVVQFVEEPHGPCKAGVMGGTSLYFLRPYHNNNTAFVLDSGLDTGSPSRSNEDFDWNFKVAPAFWVGWTSACGVGFRGRFFNFDHSSESINRTTTIDDVGVTSISGPPGVSPGTELSPSGFLSPGVLLGEFGVGQDNLSFGSDLALQTVDLEATYAYDHCHFGMLVSVGARYIQMRQNYRASLLNIVNGGIEQSTLEAGRNFYGAGPTISWQGRWEFGRSGMCIFGQVRGSLLVGSSHSSARFSEFVDIDGFGTSDETTTSESRENYLMPVGELEVGFEYARHFGKTRVFFRGAAVNQTYFEAGSATSRDGSLSLFGGQASLGLNY